MNPKDYKILVVDDEVDLVDILKEFLSLDGFEVLTAHDGVQALDLIVNGDIQLVISDIRMPKMDGLELLKNVKKVKPEILFILLSGYSDYSEEEILKKGASRLFAKPIDFEIVSQAAKKLLKI
jgi:DNA-binding NtrC family response regulator